MKNSTVYPGLLIYLSDIDKYARILNSSDHVIRFTFETDPEISPLNKDITIYSYIESHFINLVNNDKITLVL